MAYSLKVMDHYLHPRCAGSLDEPLQHIGTALIGSPLTGAVIRIQIHVDEDTQMIKAARFKTYGCGYAIATSSLLCEWLTGLSLEDALHIDAQAINYELELPPVKYVCSKLAVKAIRNAIRDYRHRHPVKMAS